MRTPRRVTVPWLASTGSHKHRPAGHRASVPHDGRSRETRRSWTHPPVPCKVPCAARPGLSQEGEEGRGGSSLRGAEWARWPGEGAPRSAAGDSRACAEGRAAEAGVPAGPAASSNCHLLAGEGHPLDGTQSWAVPCHTDPIGIPRGKEAPANCPGQAGDTSAGGRSLVLLRVASLRHTQPIRSGNAGNSKYTTNESLGCCDDSANEMQECGTGEPSANERQECGHQPALNQ